MTDLYKNKYRISSVRLKGWDYSAAARYFITICTKNHYSWFGKISNKKILLYEAGEIVQRTGLYIPDQFDTVNLGEFVVMPNHIHGVLILIKNVETRLNRDATGNSPGKPGGVTGNSNPMLNNSISRITRWFKGRCTYEIRRLIKDLYFQWQPGFYDHVIRNDKEYIKIRSYIRDNALKWREDQYYQP